MTPKKPGRFWFFYSIKTRTVPVFLTLSVLLPFTTFALAPQSNIPSLKVARTVRHGEKTLLITEKAEKKIQEIDRLTGARKIPPELLVYGLTKKMDPDTTVLVDIVLPRMDKNFFIPDREIKQTDVYLFWLILSGVETLSLDIAMGELCLRGVYHEPRSITVDLGNLSIDPLYFLNVMFKSTKRNTWESLRPYLGRLTTKELPVDIDQLKAMITLEGPLNLNTDWDMVTSEFSGLSAVPYEKRVQEEAEKQGASKGYALHHHPGLDDPLVGATSNIQDPSKRVSFSSSDIGFAKQENIEWLDIRAIGTMTEPSHRAQTTFAVYNMSVLDKLFDPIVAAIERAQADDPEGTSPFETHRLIQELLPIIKKLDAMNYRIAEVFMYVLEDRISDEAMMEEYSLRNIVWHYVDLDDNAQALSKMGQISLELLMTHRRYRTPELFHIADEAAEWHERVRQPIRDFLAKHGLTTLNVELDIQTIEEETPKLVEFLMSLGCLNRWKHYGWTVPDPYFPYEQMKALLAASA